MGGAAEDSCEVGGAWADWRHCESVRSEFPAAMSMLMSRRNYLSILSDSQVEYSNSAGSTVKSLAVFGSGLPIEKSELRATTAR